MQYYDCYITKSFHVYKMRQSKINFLHCPPRYVVNQINQKNEPPQKKSLLYWLFAIDIDKFKLHSQKQITTVYNVFIPICGNNHLDSYIKLFIISLNKKSCCPNAKTEQPLRLLQLNIVLICQPIGYLYLPCNLYRS